MKRFDIITEADARSLDVGTAVALAPGGHVTPLAQDTLRARRVTVLRDVIDADLAALAPIADIRRVVIGSDHTRRRAENRVARGLCAAEASPSKTSARTDATRWTTRISLPLWPGCVARREADAGIVIDGAGLGSTIAANKIDGVRAAMCTDQTLARYAREHNGANVLALGASLVGVDAAKAIVTTFLNTPMREARYIRRLAKVSNLERTR